MRSSLLLSALCATGALGAHNHHHKRVYVTDLSITTVTTTVTAQPDSATNSPVQEPSPVSEPSPVPEPTPSGQDQPAQTDSASTTKDDLPPVPTITPKSENNPDKGGGGGGGGGEVVAWTTAWTEGWTEVWTNPAPTTMETTTDAPTAQPTNAYQQEVLHNHNVHRSNHSSNSMAWSPTLQASAHKLAAKCVYQHDTSIDGGGYGQNIGYGVEGDSVGKMLSNLMYNGEFGYFQPYFGSEPDMSGFDKWGHLTQILWKATTEVGCATVSCNALGNVDANKPMPFTVCNYSPAGNMKGQYVANIGVPQGQPIFSV